MGLAHEGRAGYPSFAAACDAVLDHLSTRLGLDLLMVTRTEGEDWIILSRLDHSYGVEQEDVLPFRESLCFRMVQGLGPRVAPVVDLVPAYAAAPITQQVPIGTYFGVPLARPDGGLFGTLCGISPQGAPPEFVDELPLLEILSGLLAGLAERELLLGQTRRAELRWRLRAEGRALLAEAEWAQLLAAEGVECRELGTPALLIAVRPEDGSDLGLAAAAACVSDAFAGTALLARADGRIAVLLMGACEQAPEGVAARLTGRLVEAGVAARVAARRREPKEDLAASWTAAAASLPVGDLTGAATP